MDLENKKILITGASTGIGKAIAERLSKEKCKMILTARRIELLDELKKQLNIEDENIITIRCDVSKKSEVEGAFKIVKEKFGNIDVVILNAGIGHNMKVDEYNSRYAEEIFGANVFGIIYWVEQLLPGFLKKKNGIIVGVSSLADNRGYSGSGFYCASKAAASFYLEGLRVELKPYNVKVITIKPGFVKTPMTDKNKFAMPFLMPAEKAADIIVNGIKKEKRIIQFPLQMVLLTRLIGLMPGVVYEWLASRVRV